MQLQKQAQLDRQLFGWVKLSTNKEAAGNQKGIGE
jgi:hypothetical protein